MQSCRTALFSLPALLLSLSFTANSQTIQYLDKYRKPVTDTASAVFYTQTYKNPNTLEGLVRTYYKDGIKISEEQFINVQTQTRNGTTKNWYANGQLKNDISFTNNAFNGPLQSFYPNGQIRRNELYANGKLVEGHCYTKTGVDTTYHEFQTLPQFPGGENSLMKFISNNLSIPSKAGVGGLVVASFTVSTDGSVCNITILKSLGKEYDQAVVNTIGAMPKWRPGKQDGETTPLSFILPVRFHQN